MQRPWDVEGQLVTGVINENNEESGWDDSTLWDSFSNFHWRPGLSIKPYSCWSLEQVALDQWVHIAADSLPWELEEKTLLPYFVESLGEVDSQCLRLQLEAILDILGKQCHLVLCASVLPETRLWSGQKTLLLKVVLETSVHHVLHGFAQAVKADGAVAGLAVPVLPFLEDGDDYGLFPAVWKCPCVPGLVINVQQLLFCHTSNMGDHLLGNAILPLGISWGYRHLSVCMAMLGRVHSDWSSPGLVTLQEVCPLSSAITFDFWAAHGLCLECPSLRLVASTSYRVQSTRPISPGWDYTWRLDHVNLLCPGRWLRLVAHPPSGVVWTPPPHKV